MFFENQKLLNMSVIKREHGQYFQMLKNSDILKIKFQKMLNLQNYLQFFFWTLKYSQSNIRLWLNLENGQTIRDKF